MMTESRTESLEGFLKNSPDLAIIQRISNLSDTDLAQTFKEKVEVHYSQTSAWKPDLKDIGDVAMIVAIEHLIQHVIEDSEHSLNAEIDKAAQSGLGAVLSDQKMALKIAEEMKGYLRNCLESIRRTPAKAKGLNEDALRAIIALKAWYNVQTISYPKPSPKLPVIRTFNLEEFVDLDSIVVQPVVPFGSVYTLLNIDALLSIIEDLVVKGSNYAPEIHLPWNYAPYLTYQTIAQQQLGDKFRFEKIKGIVELEAVSIYQDLIASSRSEVLSRHTHYLERLACNVRFTPRPKKEDKCISILGKSISQLTLQDYETILNFHNVSFPVATLRAMNKPVKSADEEVTMANNMIEYYFCSLLKAISEQRNKNAKVVFICPLDSGIVLRNIIELFCLEDQTKRASQPIRDICTPENVGFVFYLTFPFSNRLMHTDFPIYVNEHSVKWYEQAPISEPERIHHHGWTQLSSLKDSDLRKELFYRCIGNLVSSRWSTNNASSFPQLVRDVISLFSNTAVQTRKHIERYL